MKTSQQKNAVLTRMVPAQVYGLNVLVPDGTAYNTPTRSVLQCAIFDVKHLPSRLG
jgi:hypothetical protein